MFKTDFRMYSRCKNKQGEPPQEIITTHEGKAAMRWAALARINQLQVMVVTVTLERGSGVDEYYFKTLPLHSKAIALGKGVDLI